MSETRPREGGFSLIEVTVAVAVLAIVLFGLVGAMALAAKRSALTAEMGIAQSAARRKMEEIQAQDFRDINALYNTDTLDDPGGAGTAPGATFVVRGLAPRQGQTICGKVVLPPASGSSPNYSYFETPTVSATTIDLGFPMDLNGDGDANDFIGTTRVIRCPVKVRIEWRGASGDAEFELCAVIIRR